jgi:hypothetical protein
MVDTVASKKSKYSNEDYSRAVTARQLQVRIGRPSTKDFMQIVVKNQLPNCPITREDILAAEDIFGPDDSLLKGKTTWSKPNRVRNVVTPVPPNVIEWYRSITLCTDIMHVNDIPFLVTISRNVKFGTVEALPNRSDQTIAESLLSTIRIYRQCGFRVSELLMDGEFDTDGIREGVAGDGILVNPTRWDEHVGDVERYIRTVHERMWATYNTLPFNCVPARLVIEMAKHSIFWLHAFPREDSVCGDMSPREVKAGQKVEYTRHCKFEFGEYIQTHEEHDNSMMPQTVGALAL